MALDTLQQLELGYSLCDRCPGLQRLSITLFPGYTDLTELINHVGSRHPSLHTLVVTHDHAPWRAWAREGRGPDPRRGLRRLAVPMAPSPPLPPGGEGSTLTADLRVPFGVECLALQIGWMRAPGPWLIRAFRERIALWLWGLRELEAVDHPHHRAPCMAAVVGALVRAPSLPALRAVRLRSACSTTSLRPFRPPHQLAAPRPDRHAAPARRQAPQLRELVQDFSRAPAPLALAPTG